MIEMDENQRALHEIARDPAKARRVFEYIAELKLRRWLLLLATLGTGIVLGYALGLVLTR